MRELIILLLVCFSASISNAQEDTVETKFKVFPLPVAYFTPETDWGFGVVSLFSFRFKAESKQSRISQFQFGAAYTLRNQLLIYLPFQLYLKDDNYYAFGELGYYKYSYRFFGIGTELPASNEEFYNVDFPRVRINVMKLARPNWYVGVRYWFDGYDITELKENGILSSSTITGSEGGNVSSLGLISLVDSRDDYNYPTQGTYFEFVALPNLNAFGSDFEFTRFSADYVKYLSKEKNVLAINLFGTATLGNPPFNEMALIGGTRRMRGYFEGRFRDRNMLMVQAEYRRELRWKLGLVAFTGFGVVSDKINSFESKNSKASGGLGLRYQLSKDERINLRLDYGIGEEGSSGFYLTIGEAF
jgi:outer membrane protein assembly factor BamA